MVDQNVNIQQFSSDSVSQDVTSGVSWLSSYVRILKTLHVSGATLSFIKLIIFDS